MSQTFTRIGKEISIAVRAGGPDPALNARLRAVIQNAKAANMPKDNVNRAIKKASGKEQGDYKEILFEGYAPHGVAVLVETATENNNRTVANIRSYFAKTHGRLSTQGAVEFMFEHVCHFKLNKAGQDIESIELECIDFGAEEVGEEEDGIVVYGAFSAFGTLQKYFEAHNIEILSSGFDRIPNATKSLAKAQQEEVNKLLEKLEDDEDVQNVFHNMVD